MMYVDLKALFLGAVILLLLDFIWLGWLSKKLGLGLVPVIERVQKANFQMSVGYGVLAYVLMAVALYFLAVRDSSSWQTSMFRGALVGLCVYGIFDATNAAIFRNYRGKAVVADVLWGTFLFGIAAAGVTALTHSLP